MADKKEYATVRERVCANEALFLSKYAVRSAATKGRLREEESCDFRTEFQRDRDRIIYSNSFKRLKNKTQVFCAPEGDHFITRMTHTVDVSQIARSIARTLSLNEDLAEAIALGHDLGHTPFGHVGEKVLDKLSSHGFMHNEQSLRVVDTIEKGGRGLNLTVEVRDGILNHGSARMPSTLEGRIVRFSDKIAYINHDIDDAIRAKIITEHDIPKEYSEILGNSVKERLDIMVHDIILNSMDKPDIIMSQDVEHAMKNLRQWMFDHVYKNPVAKTEENKAQQLIVSLYQYYMEHVDQLPEEYLSMMDNWLEKKERVVCDYIAGMSDRYAIDKFEELFVPRAWKV